MTLPLPIQQAVEDALSARFGVQVNIVELQNFPLSSVFRCTLQQSSCTNMPGTVIVRIPREGTPRSGRNGLYSEQTALEYLTEIGSSLAPRFLAGGGAAGFIVTEDLGTHPSLLDILLNDNSKAAWQGCVAFARSLGMLHAKTAGRHVGLPVVHVPIEEHWQQVKDAIAQLALPVPQRVDGDIEAVVRLLAESRDCLALSSGDPSVVNCKIFNGQGLFFDFETACYRHALVDASILRYLYPTGGPPWRLPNELALQIESTYRTELAQVCSIGQDNNLYERGMAAAGAAWTIMRMVRLPKVDAGPDRDSWLLLPPGWSESIPTRSRRRQLLAILETCISSSHRACAFEALAAWLEYLLDALRERWPEAAEELPLYPAFCE